MPHDITGINSGRPHQTDDRNVSPIRRRDSSDSNSSSSSSGNADTVSLTDMASRLKSLEQKLGEQPEIDQARVARIRDALSSGEFRIDPERVADKMLDFESDF